MLGNSKHLSGGPGFDPCFQDLFYLISKCRFILFNRVGQRDLHGLFWRARGPLAGICEQGGDRDVCLLAMSSSLLLSLSWGQRMGLGAWLSTLGCRETAILVHPFRYKDCHGLVVLFLQQPCCFSWCWDLLGQ